MRLRSCFTSWPLQTKVEFWPDFTVDHDDFGGQPEPTMTSGPMASTRNMADGICRCYAENGGESFRGRQDNWMIKRVHQQHHQSCSVMSQ
jgi:hypothetical protein